MKLKTCFRCGEGKPKRDFYRHSGMTDGRLGKCKDCTKEDMRVHRIKNPRPREYDRERYRNDPKRRKAAAENARRWNRRNPEGYRAHYLTSNAIRDGRLKRQPCKKCGNKKSHAHHEDYSRPLDIMWLCPICHQQKHAAERRG